MPGHMYVRSVVVASSSDHCYVTTCVCTHRSVLTVAPRVAKPFATTICGACISEFTRGSSRLYASAVQHVSNRVLHLAVTWGRMLLSVTATVVYVAKASHSAVIFVLICVSIQARDHLFVMYVDSSLHTTVLWRSICLDMVVLLCWIPPVHQHSSSNRLLLLIWYLSVISTLSSTAVIVLSCMLCVVISYWHFIKWTVWVRVLLTICLRYICEIVSYLYH